VFVVQMIRRGVASEIILPIAFHVVTVALAACWLGRVRKGDDGLTIAPLCYGTNDAKR
jgi:hypothetical protein